MNRADRMLEVLRDGQRHSRRDLFERIGFFLTNNAASELRAQGHDIEQSRERVNGDIVYFYRLRGSVASSFEPDHSPAELLLVEGDGSRDPQLADGGHGRSGSKGEGEQESLFTYPRSPAWS